MNRSSNDGNVMSKNKIVNYLKNKWEQIKPKSEAFTDPVHKAGEITALVCIVICLVIYVLLLVFMFILPKRAAKKLSQA